MRITVEGSPDKPNVEIDTNAYFILYFSDGKIKTTGDGEIDIKDLLPLILKAAADKMNK